MDLQKVAMRLRKKIQFSLGAKDKARQSFFDTGVKAKKRLSGERRRERNKCRGEKQLWIKDDRRF